MNFDKPRIALILLTYNAEKDLPKLIPAIQQQTLQPDTILVIDSSSIDNTLTMVANLKAKIHRIDKASFDHGGTRKLGADLVDADILIYLTQDAYPADPHAFHALISALCKSADIGCAFGRQLPKPDATPVSAHLRLFNYPDTSYVRSLSDSDQYGIKTCFNSDSFAAYKKDALIAAGHFPEHIMTAEDTYIAAKLLVNQFRIAYAAEACVMHSHNFSIWQEFHRYFSIGVFHNNEHWIIEHFNSASNEGLRFVISEIRYLIKTRKYQWIPRALMSTIVKFTAYQLGLHEKFIPHSIKRRLGINKSFWLKTSAVNP